MHGGRILALPTGPAGAGESRTTRNIAITLLVVVPLVAMYLAMWKFWFTSDFLASLAAAAQQSLEPFRRLGQNFFINFKQFLKSSIFHYREYVHAEINPERGGTVIDS